MGVIDQTTGVSYGTLSQAISSSSAGDVLQVSGGSYVENFPKITHSLTIQAVGGVVFLINPQAQPPNGSAVLDVALDSGVNLTVSGLDISGAANDPSSNNGAGIRFEGGNGVLRVTNCNIHGNQDGILTGGVDAASPQGGMSVFIDHSEIANNGVDSSNPAFGFDHNVYAGTLTELSVTNSYFHGALGGHEIKSRAAMTVISNNRIQDGPTAVSSYEIDVPDGGAVTVTGNTIEKGQSDPNRTMIHFGGEGTDANSSLLVDGNIFINDRANGATAVTNQTNLNGVNVAATITNNTLYNVGSANLNHDTVASPPDTASGNTFNSSGAPALDTAAGTTTPACFVGGTMIETRRGAVPVEQLHLGDVLTLASGGSRPVIWIGRQNMRFGSVNADWPVRIAAHAFGPGMPQRSLTLSPEHAVFARGVLVPVRDLVNGTSIARVAMAAVTYWHVELDRHDVILAEGLAVESYLDNANRADFEVAEALASHPMYFGADLPQSPCARLVRQGPVVEQIRAGLARRAPERQAA